MLRTITGICFLWFVMSCNPKLADGLRTKDLQKDVEIVTSKGIIVVRLSDSTPLHRNNFLKLAKQGYYDSMRFHRVINSFMIQSGSESAKHGPPLIPIGEKSAEYTVPAEFRTSLFHQKGALAAAREPNLTNPAKASAAGAFYIVVGKTYSKEDLIEASDRRKVKITDEQLAIYSTIGGTPFLDQEYTVFGQVVSGLNIVDSIALTPTNHANDRPVKDIMIIKMKLIKRSK